MNAAPEAGGGGKKSRKRKNDEVPPVPVVPVSPIVEDSVDVGMDDDDEVKVVMVKESPAVTEGRRLLVACDAALEKNKKKNRGLDSGALVAFFGFILDNNVNAVALSPDFGSWVQGVVGQVLKEEEMGVSKLDLITMALMAAPNAAEGLLDTLLPLAFSKSTPKEGEAFMVFLVSNFSRLRRLPKFLAKVLVVIREDKEGGVRLSEIVMKEIGDWIVCLSPGLTVDLWKTLAHNLTVEVIQPLSTDLNNAGAKNLLSVVADLVVTFFSNMIGIDHTFPDQTVQNFAEVFRSFLEECLTPLGRRIAESETQDAALIGPFLNMCHIYGEIFGLDTFYNMKEPSKPGPSPSNPTVVLVVEGEWPTDFRLLHPYLSSKEWVGLGSRVLKTKDASLIKAVVALVKQKVLSLEDVMKTKPKGQKGKGEEWVALQNNLKAASDFINLHTQAWPRDPESEAKVVMMNQNQQNPNSSAFGGGLKVFHTGLVIEVFTSLVTSPLVSSSTRKALVEALSPNNLPKLCTSSAEKCDVLNKLLAVLNSVLERGQKKLKKKKDKVSSSLLKQLDCISALDLEAYPTNLKTFMFLTCAIVLVEEGGGDSSSPLILDAVRSIVIRTGSKSSSQNSPLLFKVKWNCLFRWLVVDARGLKGRDDLVRLVFGNIYSSGQLIDEFQEELKVMCDGGTEHWIIALALLDFLEEEVGPKELKKAAADKVTSHRTLLTSFIVKQQESDQLTTMEEICRANFLTQQALGLMDKKTLKLYTGSLKSRIEMILNYLKGAGAVSERTTGYALSFLKSLIKSRDKLPKESLPSKLMIKVLKVVMDHIQKQKGRGGEESKVVAQLLKEMMETGTHEDLMAMQVAILELCDEGNPDHITTIVRVMTELMEAKLGPKVKALRRGVLQDCFHKLFQIALNEGIPNSGTVDNILLPFIGFQTRILKRRSAIFDPRSLAMSMTSVVGIPLESIVDLNDFCKLFEALSDLLNALVLHRLDVVSFRTHVFQQCFAHLIDALTKRGDQRHALSDKELNKLKVCAHTIERMCQSIKLGQTELNRSVPYLLAAVMKQFEACTVYPLVKGPLVFGVHKLLDACDSQHGIPQLNSLLSAGGKEILKTVFEEYGKYYKYKGRV